MNKNVFKTGIKVAPNTVNSAGGSAFKDSNEEALATFAMTCTFADSFYDKANDQLT